MSRVELIHGDELKTGDTAPDMLVKLIKDNNVPRDLSSVDEVRLVLAEVGEDETVVDATTSGGVTIGEPGGGNGTNGYVQYAWDATDTEKARTLIGEFIVTPSTNEQEHYPNSGYFNVYIEEGLI